MVARTTPARRAISAMLASGSLASASTAASRMRAMLRSASARRPGGSGAVALGVVIGWLVDGDTRGERELGQECPGRGEDDERGGARGAGDDGGDQEGVADAVGETGRGGRSDSTGGDRGQDRDSERTADLVAGGVQARKH